uniref:Uncharacterized protein n=1 Tax=Aplanochytrium stocchinoi TaxID=215587 RepID=A0A6S8BM07_9STRA
MEEEWENIDLKEKEGAVSGGRDLDLSLFQDDKDEIGKTVTAVLKDANGHLNGNENGKHADHAWLCLERDDSGNMILSLLEDKKTKKKRKSNGDEDCKNDENDDDGFGEWEVLDCKSEEVFFA